MANEQRKFWSMVRERVAEKGLCDLLVTLGFEIASTETIKYKSRSSNIPVEYIRAVKV